jgi:hypothetical protein
MATSTGTVLRFGDIGRRLSELFNERRGAVLGYWLAAVLIPYLLFFIFPQSNMRGFGAFLLNVGAWYSAETPWTIASMFMIAIWGITAFVFCAWSAMLTEVRDEIAGEVMSGLVAALLFSAVWTVINTLSLIMFGLIAYVIELGVSVSDAVFGWLVTGLFTAFYIWLLSRLCLAGPVMAAEGSLNPFRGLGESWRLTSGHWPKVAAIIGPLYLLVFGTCLIFVAIAVIVLMQTDGTTWHDRALSGSWLIIEFIAVGFLILIPAALYRAIRPAVDMSVFD